MENEKSNLEFWESVEKTNPNKTKTAQKGQLKLTAINATTQIKAATEKWGMYGATWGLDDISYSYIDIDDTKVACISARFFYPECNEGFPINSSLKMAYMTNGQSGYLKVDDDFMKKLETDVTTKALSKLGFNADVFMGLFDDNKYLAALNEEFKEPVEKKPLIANSEPFHQAITRKVPIEKMEEHYFITEPVMKAYLKALEDGNN